MRSCQRTQHQPFYGCLPLEANWKGEKLDKWVPHELTTDQRRKSSFWSVVACYSTQHQWTTSQLVCDMQWKVDFIRQPAVMSSVAGSRRSSKAPPKAKLALINGSRSLFCCLLPVWSAAAFWILAKPLHPRSMLSKLMKCTKNCNVCSEHWSTERASVTMPDCMLHNQCFKSGTNWAVKLCLICHIHWTSRQLTTISSRISTTFCRENASTTSRRQKMLSKSSSNPQTWICMQ